MNLVSPDFQNQQPFPPEFTCDGEDINPEIQIQNPPENTASLVLIFDHPDSPSGNANPGWVHWIAVNIDPSTQKIAKNTVPSGAIQGQNDFGNANYGGPCPHGGTHMYVFRLFALDTKLNFDEPPTKAEVVQAMQGHILDQAEYRGSYNRD